MKVTKDQVIALVDPYVTGHHAPYFKLFARGLLDLGYKVMAFYPHPDEIRQWIDQMSPQHATKLYTFAFTDTTRSKYSANSLGILLTTSIRWRLTAQAIQQAIKTSGLVPDLVFLAWLDAYLQPLHSASVIDRIFPFSWTGLYYHPRHYRLDNRYPRMLAKLLYPDNGIEASRCRGIAILDEGIQAALQQNHPHTRVIVFPDPTDPSTPVSSDLAERAKIQAQGRKIVGLLGSLDKRKGVIPFLRVAELAKRDNFFFLLAGRLAENTFSDTELTFIRQYQNATPENCLIDFTHIAPESKFNGLITLCDIVCAVYLDFPHSSGIMTKAAMLEKPLIVSEKYCMGERVRKYQLGLTVKENDVDALYQAIYQLAHIQEPGSPVQLCFDFATYRQIHSNQQLQQAFTTLLEVG